MASARASSATVVMVVRALTSRIKTLWHSSRPASFLISVMTLAVVTRAFKSSSVLVEDIATTARSAGVGMVATAAAASATAVCSSGVMLVMDSSLNSASNEAGAG